MLLRFSIAMLLALAMQARGDLLVDQVKGRLGSTHSLHRGEKGARDGDRHYKNVPEPSPLLPLAVLLGGTWLVRKRVHR